MGFGRICGFWLHHVDGQAHGVENLGAAVRQNRNRPPNVPVMAHYFVLNSEQVSLLPQQSLDTRLLLSHNVAQSNGVMRVALMGTNAVVRARIDGHLKEEAAAVLASMGLTVSDAFRLMLVRVAAEKKLPFEPLIPNAKTIEAMKAARRGELVTVGDADSLMASLHEGDQVRAPLQA